MVKITDLDVIQAIDDLYNEQPFDHILDGSTTEGVYVGIRYIGNFTLVIYRGSTTLEDWAKDFFAIPHTPVTDPQLGPLHAGFSLGGYKAKQQIKPLVRGDLIIGGHSLGAAESLIGSGYFVTDGSIVPKSVVIFGEPKPGFKQLADILTPITDIRSYRNCSDLVTDVPFDILNFDYVHPRPLIQLDVPPADNDPWGPLGAHHHELYFQGIKQLPNIPVIIEG